MKHWEEIVLRHYDRINVIGCSASGKSTFSRRLADLLGIPYVELDAVFWGPNWSQPASDVFYPRLEKALEPDSWVLDGNYSRTTPIKWNRVQAVIWLDYSFPRTILRSIKRATARAISKKELWPGTGNRETFRKGFLSRDSIILWAIQNHGKIRRRYEALDVNGHYRHIDFIRLASPEKAEAFLKALEARVLKGSGKNPDESRSPNPMDKILKEEYEKQIGTFADN